MNAHSTDNVHEHELRKFGALAERWWDTRGQFKALHAVNPCASPSSAGMPSWRAAEWWTWVAAAGS